MRDAVCACARSCVPVRRRCHRTVVAAETSETERADRTNDRLRRTTRRRRRIPVLPRRDERAVRRPPPVPGARICARARARAARKYVNLYRPRRVRTMCSRHWYMYTCVRVGIRYTLIIISYRNYDVIITNTPPSTFDRTPRKSLFRFRATISAS